MAPKINTYYVLIENGKVFVCGQRSRSRMRVKSQRMAHHLADRWNQAAERYRQAREQ